MSNSAKAPTARDGGALDFDPSSLARIDVSNIPPHRDRQAYLIRRRFGLAPHVAAIIAAHVYGEART